MDMKTCKVCRRTMAGYLFPLDSDTECDVCRAERLDREVREAHEERMRSMDRTQRLSGGIEGIGYCWIIGGTPHVTDATK